MIRLLAEDVRCRLRSGVAMTSVAQCVEELLLNSLDAGATCLAVRLDLDELRVQVVDNGCGVCREDLERLGRRYFTSKCHSADDLEDLRFSGFRGEAIASMVDVCSVVEICSRHRGTAQTFSRLFQNGKPLEVAESESPRASSGTTVTLYKLFSKLPVRRRCLEPAVELERIRHRVEAVSLVKPAVSFSLKNEAVQSVLLQLPKAKDTRRRFCQIYGSLRSESLREVRHTDGGFTMEGLVSCEGHYNRTMQFLYVNNRLVLKTQLHKLMDVIIRRESSICRGRGGRPRSAADLFGIFIVNIQCPVWEYDICFQPDKTLIEFQDWDGVMLCTERGLRSFLHRENLFLAPSRDDTDQCSPTHHYNLSCESGDQLVASQGPAHPDDSANLRSRCVHRSSDITEAESPLLPSNVGSGITEGGKVCHSHNVPQNPGNPRSPVPAQRRISESAACRITAVSADNAQCPVPRQKERRSSVEHGRGAEASTTLGGTLERFRRHYGRRDGWEPQLCRSPEKTQAIDILPPPGIQKSRAQGSTELNPPTLSDCMDLNSQECTPKLSTKLCRLKSHIETACWGCTLAPSTPETSAICVDGGIESPCERQPARNQDGGTCEQQAAQNKDGGTCERLPAHYKDGGTCELLPAQNKDGGSCKRQPAWSQDGGTCEWQPAQNKDGGTCERLPAQNKDGGTCKQPARNQDGGTCEWQPAQNKDGGTCERLPAQNKDGGGTCDWLPAQNKDGGTCERLPAQNKDGGTCERLPAQNKDGGTCEWLPAQNKDGGTCEWQPAQNKDGGTCERLPAQNKDGGTCERLPAQNKDGGTCERLPAQNKDGGTCERLPAENKDGGRCERLPAQNKDGGTCEWQPAQNKDGGTCERQAARNQGGRTCEWQPAQNKDGGTCERQAAQNKDGGTCERQAARNQDGGTCEQQAARNQDGGTCETQAARNQDGGTCERSSEEVVSQEWLQCYEESLGKNVFINSATGLSSYSAPTRDKTAVCTQDVSNVAVTVVGSKGFWYQCHPLKSRALTPFLPRPRDDRDPAGQTDNGTVSSLYTEWKNPVYERLPALAVDVSQLHSDAQSVKIHNILYPYRFTKEMVHSIEVLQQVDSKFIVCLMNATGGQTEAASGGHLLVLVDQHAAHERVRLEQLIADSFEASSGACERQLKVSVVDPALEVQVSEEDYRVLRTRAGTLRRVGLSLSVADGGSPRVLLSEIPLCFVEREASEMRRGRSAVLQKIVQEYLQEQVQLLQMPGAGHGAVPGTVLKVLASQACHGAVKFNQPLTVDECRHLLRSLAQCSLPFQCAHGRPSILPLADLQHLCPEPEDPPAPNLRYLRRRYQAWQLDEKCQPCE